MAQALYDSYKKDLLDRAAGVDYDTDTIRAIFVTAAYVFSAAHDFFDDLTNTFGDGGSARADGETLLSKTVVAGLADAADTVFASVTATSLVAFVLYKDTGADGTSNLIGYFDSISTISPTAAQVTINYDAAGIFFF